VSDIEYLAVKEKEGKLVQNDGNRTTTGDLCTLTASSGKDMYFASAKINAKVTGTAAALTVTLDVNGSVIETALIPLATALPWADYEYISKGFKVAATQIIKLEVTAINNTEVQGELVCFEETTGDDPRL